MCFRWFCLISSFFFSLRTSNFCRENISYLILILNSPNQNYAPNFTFSSATLNYMPLVRILCFSLLFLSLNRFFFSRFHFYFHFRFSFLILLVVYYQIYCVMKKHTKWRKNRSDFYAILFECAKFLCHCFVLCTVVV